MASAQHPGGRWLTIETAHYRVHARPAHRALALRAAAEAEAAWTALAAVLSEPGHEVDLVVADNVDDANGFATTYPVPTIVIYAFPPAGDIQLGAYDRWLRLVITHELAHVFQLEQTRGWWRVARALFGRVPALFPNEYAPSWLSEGAAVYHESRLTGQGRLYGAFHRAVVDAQLAERGRLPMGAAGALSPRWPGGIRPYAFGSEFVGVLATRFGDSTVTGLIGQIARRPLPYIQLNGALRGVAGVSLKEAWRVWMDSLEAGCRGAGGQGCGTDSSESVLVRGLRTAGSLRMTDDGRRLLFVHADGREEARIAVWDRDAAALVRLARVNSDGGATWLGDTVLLAQLEFGDPWTLRSDLWAVNRSGAATRLTREARLREPDAARSGAIVAVRAVPGGNELVLLERDSVLVLAPAQEGIEWSSPRFSPDGRAIAAVRVRAGRHDIVLLGRDRRVTAELTADAATDRTPAFTPDGAMVVWSRDAGGRAQIVGRRLADGATFRLTRAPFGAYAPAPAGDSLFYLSYHADGFRLVAVPFAPEPAELETGAPGHRGTGAPEAPPPAPEIVREGRYSPLPALAPHYWLPSLVTMPGGTFAGLLTSSQDPLGRHFYLLDAGLGLGAMAGKWRGTAYYAWAGRPPAVLDLAASRDQRQYLVDSAGAMSLRCCLVEDQVDLGVVLTRRRWRSGVSVRLGSEYERIEAVGRRAGASLALGVARTVAAPQAVSPQRGWRASVTLRQRWRLGESLSSRDVVVVGAGFVPAAMFRFARQVLAVRGAAGFIGGNDRVSFGVGGVAGGSFEVVPGLTVGGGSRSFPVRGYPASSLFGRTVAAASVEFRSPVAMVGDGPGLFPPLTLDRLSTAVFADLGAARAQHYCGDTTATGACGRTLVSAGGELVVDAGIPYDFPVRFRVGAAWRFGPRSAAVYAAVGSAF